MTMVTTNKEDMKVGEIAEIFWSIAREFENRTESSHELFWRGRKMILRFEEAKASSMSDIIHCIALPSTKTYMAEWASEEI